VGGRCHSVDGHAHWRVRGHQRQIRSVLTELGRSVELTSGGGNKSRGGGGRGGLGTIVRNAEWLVVDGREAWLTLTVHRTAVELHAEGADVEASALACRAGRPSRR
jgi:hypothetical protein